MRHWVCSSCGFDIYNNVAAAVGVIVKDGAGRVLFIKRAKEPRKGFLALPGGFIDPGESAEQAAVRECKEETGLDIMNLTYVASFPNVYEYKTVRYTTCDIFFTARTDSPEKLESLLYANDGESAGFCLYPVDTANQIDAIPLAFPSASRALNAVLLNDSSLTYRF
jgi:ADP-ribose pyrophosphatase YjhB (NUDIX family)